MFKFLIFNFLFLGNGLYLNAQNFPLRSLVSCLKKDELEIKEYQKTIEKLRTIIKNDCHGKDKKSRSCKKGFIINSNYKYEGPYHQNSPTEFALIDDDYNVAFNATILFPNGTFFSGQFIKKDNTPSSTEPINGFLFIDEETYYIGDVTGVIEKGIVNPNGSGTKFKNGCNGAEISQGIWKNGVLQSQHSIYRIKDISVLSPNFCNQKKEEIIFLDETINTKKKSAVDAENHLMKLSIEIQQLQDEQRLINQTSNNAGIREIKEILTHYKSISSLVNNDNLKASLIDFQNIMYSQDAQLNNNYDGKLNNHIKSFDFEKYDINDYIIREMTSNSLQSLWNKNGFKPRFSSKNSENKIYLVSFFKKNSPESYNVILFKNLNNQIKIIQLFLL